MSKKSDNRSYTKEAYLTTTANSLEAETMEALLRSSGIPVMKKFREAGAYLEIYMGASNFGVDLYVPSDLLDKAREITGLTESDEAETQQSIASKNQDTVEEKEHRKRQRLLAGLLIIFVAGGILCTAVAVYSWLIY